MNSNTYFCSDLHFRHHNVLKFDEQRGRLFQSIEHHNDYLANEILSLPKNATLYFLGDLCWKMDDDTKKWMHSFLSSVKCELHWIKGNHDYKDFVNEYGPYFHTIRDYAEEKYEGRKFILCHFPLLSWNGMNREDSSIHIHGHNHSHDFFTDGTRYNIAYNGHKLLRHIDGFIDGSHKMTEKYISNVPVSIGDEILIKTKEELDAYNLTESTIEMLGKRHTVTEVYGSQIICYRTLFPVDWIAKIRYKSSLSFNNNTND